MRRSAWRPFLFRAGVAVPFTVVLAAGLGLAALKHTGRAGADAGIAPSRPAAHAPTQARAVLVPAAFTAPHAKAARATAGTLRDAAGEEPRSAPLAADRFNQRFGAATDAKEARTRRYAASLLLSRPQRSEVQTAFAVRSAVGLEQTRAFHLLAAAVPAAADAVEPVRLAALESDADTEGAGGAADPGTKLAVLSEALKKSPETIELPDHVELPNFRPLARTAKSIARSAVAVEPERGEGPAPTLAYARPDEPIEKPFATKPSIPWPGTGRRTAVYDISAGVVHMPNGERLEAHSGRGKMRDNPKFVHVKMRGPTPPSTYRLTMREALFHGVQAIRLTPLDGVAPHGRVGLLAHTYLLRNAPPGDSSGCVVFKDYRRFLNAFKRGEVDRMVVVASMGSSRRPALTARVVSLFNGR